VSWKEDTGSILSSLDSPKNWACIGRVEVLGFTGGYKAGVIDLMTAVTFNQLGITKPEYAESAPTGK